MNFLRDYHPNQRDAAKEIMEGYLNGYHHQVLGALPQAGKTGVGRAVIHLFRKHFPDVEVWIICGMNCNDLKEQEKREFENYVDPDNILFSKDLESFENSSGKRVDPYFKAYRKRRLFILDESHFAQNVKGSNSKKKNDEDVFETKPSLVYRFFTKRVGVTLDANKEKWIEQAQDTYILSISATPMSEVAHINQPGCAKQIVILKPVSTYYGFSKMLELGRLKQAFNLNTEKGRTGLLKVLHSHYEKQKSIKKFKYVIVRFNNNKTGQKSKNLFVDGLKAIADVDIIDFHSKEMDISDINKEVVNKEPEKMTLVMVYNSLRAGVQLNTKNICLTHEMHSAGTDVTGQALPGRCSGYDKEEHGVEIYCNVDAIKKYLIWVEHEFDPQYIPSGCRNIKESVQSKMEKKHVFMPNKVKGVKLSNQLIDRIEQWKKGKSGKYVTKFWTLFGADVRKELNESGTVDNSFWTEYIFKSAMIFMNNEESSWKAWWYRTKKAYDDDRCAAPFYGTNDEDLVNGDKFYFVYINADKNRCDYGWVYVPSKYKTEVIELRVRTTGNEQYHPDNNPDLNEGSQCLTIESTIVYEIVTNKDRESLLKEIKDKLYVADRNDRILNGLDGSKLSAEHLVKLVSNSNSNSN